MLSRWVYILRFSLVWGSGLKCDNLLMQRKRRRSSPSYEGVDWNIYYFESRLRHNNVLPRMREWIEIVEVVRCKDCYYVLPRMREWIEISAAEVYGSRTKFSLVWGSGLKLFRRRLVCRTETRSPSYEGVDWNITFIGSTFCRSCSPSYEGVDWNVKTS